MRRIRIYFLFCLAVLSLVVCFWYGSSPALPDFYPTRRELFLEYETALANEARLDQDWEHGDPCETSIAKEQFVRHLDGRMQCHTSRSYTSQFPIFNTLLSINPKLSITPTSINDIVLALKFATKMNLTVTVRNGGHNPAGFSINEGGMVIDMAFLRRVQFLSDSTDPSWSDFINDDYVLSQGGALWSDVHALLKRRQLVSPLSIVGGGCPSVGVVGLALGGGIGWTSRNHGLVSDNMLGVKLVFPNGTLAVITEDRNPELMWALRGAGGSNFGVVVEIIIRTFPARRQYLAGRFDIMRDPDDAEDIINLYSSQILNRELDRRLTVDLFLMTSLQSSASPKIQIGFGLIFDGPIKEGVRVLQPLLDSLAGQLTQEDACEIQNKLCSTNEGNQAAYQLTREWIKTAGPFLQNHTFLSWSTQFGMKHANIHWTNGVFSEWTPSLTKTLLKSFKSTGVSHLPTGVHGNLHATFEQLGGKIGQGPSLWKHKNTIGLVSFQTMLFGNKNIHDDVTGESTIVDQQMKSWTDRCYRRMQNAFTGVYSNYADEELTNWEDKYYGLDFYNRLVDLKTSIPDTLVFSGKQRIGQERLEGNTEDFVSSEKLAERQLDRDSLEAETSLLCPNWLVDHALMATPSDIVVSSTTQKQKPRSNLQDLQNPDRKTVLLTGGSGGIGFSAVLNFLALGVNVITTSQTSEKCRETEAKIYTLFQHEQISNSSNFGSLFCFDLQLDDLESIEQFIMKVKSLISFPKLSAVVLNVAHNGSPGTVPSAGGLSRSLLVNHLGHFYLTLLLLQEELIQPTGRVIIQSSGAAMRATEEQILSLLEKDQSQVEAVNQTEQEGSVFESPEFLTYAVGKALNVIFALEFHRRIQYSNELKELQIFITLPPGTAETELSQYYLKSQSAKEELLGLSTLISTAEAALPCVYASLEKLDQFNIVFVENNFTRELEWEYKQQPMGVQFVMGCQAGSVAARFRFVDWLKVSTTCRIWNWGVKMLRTLRRDHLRIDEAPLKNLQLRHCTP
eukprot:g4300.t1